MSFCEDGLVLKHKQHGQLSSACLCRPNGNPSVNRGQNRPGLYTDSAVSLRQPNAGLVDAMLHEPQDMQGAETLASRWVQCICLGFATLAVAALSATDCDAIKHAAHQTGVSGSAAHSKTHWVIFSNQCNR